MSASSKSSVLAALGGNAVIMVAKFVVFSITGSGALFAEAIHSVADVGNQALLLVGIVRSGRGPTEKYQYGHGRERFVWALISAVGIFFLGCGVTLAHGIDSLLSPHEEMELVNPNWAIGVLVASLLIEGFVLAYAVIGLRKAAAGRPFFDYLRRQADPSAVAVILEDSAACLGVILAIGAIGLTEITGKGYWDAIGSVLIGLLLGAVAVWLTFRNKELLIGPSAPDAATAAIRAALMGDDAVERIVRLKSKVLDTETYDVLVELEFHGERLAETLRPRLEAAYEEGFESFDEFNAFAKEYADEVVALLGDKIDELEKKIQDAVPEVKHIDVEPD
ncbi:MAG: cobalt transporter [Deltaproteobacteria bacterium]|nr:MAG: cobalt transporter [Deltaproteobacteria bacterium]